MSINFESNTTVDLPSTLAVRFAAPDLEGAFPLSPTQAGMLFHSLFAPAAGLYLEQIILRIDGELDMQLFENSWQMVIDHHEILRTSFRWQDQKRPLQIVHPQVTLPFQEHDCRELAPAEQASRMESFLMADRKTGFDFTQPPLMRLALFRLAADSYRLVWTNHHALLDGWSHSLVLKQVFSVYRAFVDGEVPTLEPSPAYRKYIDWLAAQNLNEAEQFWKQALKGFGAPTSLGVDRPNTESRGEVVAHEELGLQLSVEATESLQAFARKHRLTMFTLVAGAWALLLSRYGGTDDVVFGATVSVRPDELPDIESAAGLFINTIPVRARLAPETDLVSWLKELQLDAVEAREHQHTSLVDIQRWSEVPNGLPLFESIFVFENYPVNDDQGNLGRKAAARQVRAIFSRTNYPLTLIAFPGVQLQLAAVYDNDRFDGEAIRRMLGHLQTMLTELVADPLRKLDELPLLTAPEQKQLVVDWNQTESEYEKDRCVHQLFESQVARTPDAIAVEFEDCQLTYSQLNTRANQLAHYLRGLGIGAESLVGVCVERSLEMMVGLLGIMKAGAAYVPLDPAFPRERLAFMIDDARVPVLLTQQKLSAELPPHQARLVCLDSEWDIIAHESTENPEHDPVGGSATDNLAYVIYTSGSTGKPKGVQIGHRALTNFLCSVRREPGLAADDVLLSVTTLSFDIAALELYLPLIVGARLVIVSRDVAADGNELKARLAQTGATVVQATPATWRMLIDAGWQGSERLKALCGGESLSRALADQLLERSVSLWNMYGPTETTIWSTLCKVESGKGPISIGRPLANTKVYLLDNNLSPVPIGIAGELHIGGDGLARGYFNRPELTSEKFIRNPFSGNPAARLYKTGDLARYLPDGNIECLGRIDDQVKLRGFRIELGEIEAVLRQHETVRDSVVTAREDAPGDRRLVAYIVPRAKSCPTNFSLSPQSEQESGNNDKLKFVGQELRDFLKQKLPEYMIPSVVIELAELPLTPNGKVNRRALPAPDYDAQLKQSYIAPRTPAEELLCGIWAEVLKVSRVGVHDNFFELGGHSLLATQVISRVLPTFKVQLPLRALFEAPTVAGMAERIEASREDTTTSTVEPITRARRGEGIPLSCGQQSFWFLDSLTPNTSHYNIFRAVRLRGPLNAPALQQALDGLMARHESMRTIFSSVDGQPVQVIVENQKLSLSEVGLGHLSPATQEPELGRLLKEEVRRPFDLAHGPLVRATLFRLDALEHVLLLSMHHIVADDWSLGIMSRDLKELYDSFVMDQPPQLPELPVQYADFALWQHDRLQNGTLDRQLQYWKRQLAGSPPLLELPTDYPRPADPTFRGAHHTLTLSATLRDQLVKLSRDEGGTLFMTLLAAFQILLARQSGQDDIVVGSPIAGRNRVETENLIGPFINTLVLRTSLAGDPTFSELLHRVRDVALGAYTHQETPFERLVEELQPERSLSHTPLFQAMFVFQNAPVFDLNLSGLSVTKEKLYSESSPLDLNLEARETSEGIRCDFEYKTDLFDAATIERIGERFQLLLERIIDDPAQRISGISLLAEAEQRRLLVDWNDNRAEFPRDACIHQLFEAQVERTPDAIAAEFQGEQITYRELNNRANQLARFLKKQGVVPDTLVGICVHRSLEMLVGMFGVLKAGGAYVPLDPAYPADRLAFMIEDAGLSLVLTQERLISDIPGGRARLFCLDKDWARVASESEENPVVTVSSSSLAYVIYTSGSTGNPKGVMIEHRSLVNFSVTAGSAYAINPADRVLQFATLCFDISVEEIYPALTHGATVVLRTDEMIRSARDFLRCCNDWRVTVLDLPTAYWHDLTDTLSAGDLKLPELLRLVIIGGEKAAFDRVAAWHKLAGDGVRLLNTYGPTEATVVATMCDLRPQDESSRPITVPIGRPLANATVYVLDQSLRPVPIGVPGELHIGGPGVARGYVNRPELTGQKFIQDPFSNDRAARLYRTGDLVRYRPDGNIEFLGRIDNQVKIRGFRVELEEIEEALRSHANVSECVVVLREESDGDKRLIAYLVRDGDSQPTTSDLRNFLKTKLPSYMMPAAFEIIDELPLMPNGKIDRRALPAPQPTRSQVEAFAAPADELELRLSRIWEQVLRLKSISVDDNFFEIGGHSLLAVRLFAQIEKSFGRNLPLATLFQAPTVKQLARVLRQEGWPAAWSSLVVIQGGNKRTPFFCIHAAGGNVLEYEPLARLLGPDQPFYGLQARGLDGKSEPHTSIKEMAAHYIKEMREVQSAGPYLIGGRSSGGTVAFEMACQLEAEGQEVALLALLDTYPSGYFKLRPGSLSLGQRAGRYGRKLSSHAENLRQLSAPGKLAYMFGKLKYAPEKAKHKLYWRAYRIYKKMGRPLPPALKNIEEINFAAVREYVPQTYSGDVTLFLASDLTAGYDLQDGWRELVDGNIESHEISGNHINIIKEPHVRVLAEKLSGCLERAQEDHSTVRRAA